VVGELATPVAAGIKAVGSVLSWFGFSTPINLASTVPMQIRAPRVLQFEDNPTTVALGPVGDGTSSKDYALVNDEMESSTVLRFCQRPTLLYVGTITSAMTTGTILWEQVLNPGNLVCYDYVNPVDTTDFVGVPMQYMARFANYWRGGMRFHLSFICSHFHSVRVKLFYIPYIPGTVATPPNPTEAESTNLINTIIDITRETEYSFTVPYCQIAEWLATNPAGAALVNPSIQSTAYGFNGSIGLQLINPLTAGAATVNPIYYQIFVSAAADFQLAMPEYGHNYGYFQPQTYVPQTAFDLLECEIPSMSMQCLMDKDYPPLGNIAKGRTNHKTYMIKEITSIKQLTNMLAPFSLVQAGVLNISKLLVVNGGDFYSGPGPGTSQSIKNYATAMASVFRYQRGGMRVYLRTTDPEAQVWVNCEMLYGNISPVLSATTITGDPNDPDANNLVQSAMHFPRTSITPCDVVIPWNCQFHCLPTRVGGSANVDLRYLQQADITATLLASTSSLLFIGGADDFILGFQMGIPRSRVILV